MEKYQIRGLDGSYIGEPYGVIYRKTVTDYDVALTVGKELADMIADIYGRSHVAIVEKDEDGCLEVVEEIYGDYSANKSFDKAKLDTMIKELTKNGGRRTMKGKKKQFFKELLEMGFEGYDYEEFERLAKERGLEVDMSDFEKYRSMLNENDEY